MTVVKGAYPEFPPDKRRFAIGEAARLSLTKPHIVRYWEKSIPQLSDGPRRHCGRRYYSVEDIVMLRRVRGLLIHEGYTIAGVVSALNGKEEEKKGKGMAKLRRDIEQIIEIL